MRSDLFPIETIDVEKLFSTELAGRIAQKNGPEWRVHSPWREDAHPSMSVNVNNGVFNDFADSEHKGGIVDFVAQLHNLNKCEAWDYIKKNYGYDSQACNRNSTQHIERRTQQATHVKPVSEPVNAVNDYCYREIVRGAITNRGTVLKIDSPPDYFGQEDAFQCFHSHYCFNQTFQEYAIGKGSVGGFSGPCAVKTLVFDVDNKDNLAEAQVAARCLIYRLSQCKIPIRNMQVYFSGNKGFHVEVFDPAFAMFSFRDDTPELVYRRSAERPGGLVTLLAQTIPFIDFSIYDRLRLIRSVNSRHEKSGLFKVPLTLHELHQKSEADIRKLAEKQRHLEGISEAQK